MKRLILSVGIMAIGCNAYATDGNVIDERVSTLLSETMYQQERIKVPIVFLGLFHFKDAGLDSYKPQHAIDVYSEKTQKEIEDIVDRLSDFAPTKIAVERKWQSDAQLQEQYDAYLKGSFELPANELYQIGFRLAKKLGHKKVYPVDAPGRNFGPGVDAREFAKENKLTRQLREPYSASRFMMSRRMDEMKTQFPLREHLLLMNHPDILAASHSVYLQKSLSLGKEDTYPIADGFVSTWYNRNIRIFGNIHRISDEEDKILAIFGAGHVPLLKHFAENSAEFSVVELSDVLE